MTSSIVKLDDNLGPDSSMAIDPEAAGEGIDYEMESDKAQLSSESNENLQSKENRVMKKAHRTSKNGDTTEPVVENGVPQTGGGHNGVSKHGINMTHKNNRRRRHARGRVQLKKGNRLLVSDRIMELSLLRTFAPGSESTMVWNFRSLELSFPGTFAPWNFRSLELSFPGAKVLMPFF